MMKQRRFGVSVALLLTIAPVILSAQTGVITGRVVDQATRGPLPGANVQLVGTSVGSSTDADGRFALREVPVGTYRVRASLVGYQQMVMSDVVVATGKPVQLEVALDQTPVDLEAVEVTAGYFRRTPDAPVSVQSLSAEEIRRSPGGFEDVLRAIAVLPGVSQVEAGRNDLVVRGGAPSENLYVIDNIEVPNINHFGTQGSAGGALSFVNLDFVRETLFSTGGFGVKFGDRISSVLQIDLREGRQDRIGGKGTISATQFGLNVEGPVSESSSFILSVRRSYLDFIFKAAGFNFVPEYWDVLGRLTFRLDSRNSLSAVAIGSIDRVSFFNDDADQRLKNSRILGTGQDQYVSGVTWEHLLGTGFVHVTLGRSLIRYDGVQNDTLLRPIFTNRSKEGETSLRADAVFRTSREGKHEVSAGVMAKRMTLESALLLPATVTSFGDSIGSELRNVRSSGVRGSAYLQGLFHLPWNLQFIAGVRADYTDQLAEHTTLSPRASLTWEASQFTSLTVAAGIYRQHPALLWLEADPRNRELLPARADQFIFGVDHSLRADLRIRGEIFVKRYTNYPASADRRYLVLANTGGGYGGAEEGFASFGLDHLVSGGVGRAYGVELSAQKKLSEIPLYGVMSLTWARAMFTPLDGLERPGAYDQRFVSSAGAGYRFDEKWEVSARFRYATGRPYTPFQPGGGQQTGLLYSERLKDFHALDVRVDRRWNFESWNLTLYLDVQNVYDNEYSSGVRWNAREQRAEERDASIGLLPSIGVSAEF